MPKNRKLLVEMEQALFEYNAALAALQRAVCTKDIEKEIPERKTPTK